MLGMGLHRVLITYNVSATEKRTVGFSRHATSKGGLLKILCNFTLIYSTLEYVLYSQTDVQKTEFIHVELTAAF